MGRREQGLSCAGAKWKNRRGSVMRRASPLRVLFSLRTIVIPANTLSALKARIRRFADGIVR